MEKRLKLSEDNILKTAKSVAEGIIHYEAETFDGKEYIMRVNPMQKCKVCDAANGVESLYPAKLYVDFVGLEEKREKVFEIRRRFYAEGQEYLLLQDEKEELYLRAYQENPDLRSVCHAHPPICTSFSIAGIPLDVPVLAEAVITLGDVPIAPYAELGTKEVAEVIAPYCHTHNGVLLANHGAVTWAEDAYAAYYRLESMEYYANILMITGKILGKQNCFTKEQVDRLIAMREKFGISRGGTPVTDR